MVALLARIRTARAGVWDAGARPDTITLNIDATLLTGHSEKELAGGNYKQGYGFHPLNCNLDETGEALAALLRPGNAGSNTAEDHFTVLGLALAQLPAEELQREVLVRTDIGGCTHSFTSDCRDAGIRFSVGYELTDTVRQAILDTPEVAWVRAVDAGGADREGAWIAELTDRVDLSAWPQGARLACRRERPHPGAQFTIFDDHGYWYMCFLTDQDGEGIAALGCATAVELASRTESGVARTRACATFRTTPSPTTRRGLADRPRPLDLDQADLPGRRARDRRAQTPSSAAPPSSCATGAAPISSSTATGPGRRRSPPRSDAFA